MCYDPEINQMYDIDNTYQSISSRNVFNISLHIIQFFWDMYMHCNISCMKRPKLFLWIIHYILMNNKTVASIFRIPLLFFNLQRTYNKSNNQYIAVKCKRQYQYIRAAADTNRRFELCVRRCRIILQIIPKTFLNFWNTL